MIENKLVLFEEEQKKFLEFLDEHSKCSNDETLAGIYNVKLVFNMSNEYIVVTCFCASCDAEELLSGAERLEEYE